MKNNSQNLYEQVCRHAREATVLRSIEDVLGWDERTMMPRAGGEHRAEQMTLLAGMVHQRHTDPKYGEQLAELTESPLAADELSETGVNISRLKRQYDKKTKLPQTLVEELTRTSVLGQQAWQAARANDDFPAFQPMLEKMFHLKRQEAEALGYAQCPYDALLDDYEPGLLTSEAAAVLAGLRDELVPLVEEIRASGRQPDVGILKRGFPIDKQDALGRQAAGLIGFDFDRGRLDPTAHPFCSSVGPRDCRITTRFDEHFFGSAFFSILHESGHGLYEQGLREEQYGLPLGEAVSLGIHESQSRLWENQVGRGRPFWEHLYPQAKKHFPIALKDVPLDDFVFAINDVRPSAIRVEADEATYNLHILIRFELERSLLDGELKVADLPDAWNEKYRHYLGIEPPNDADGVLQDIHWSAGLVGYFPTYALGNLYAAQLFEKTKGDLGDLDKDLARGNCTPLREWLGVNIHRQGQRRFGPQLVEYITGKPPSHASLIAGLRAKLGPLYGIS